MNLGGAVSPTPEPSYSNDPFNPDVTIWPEAPSWLFPAVMVGLVIISIVVIVLLLMWRKSLAMEKMEREAKGPTEWIDLSKLGKKGRWEEDDATPKDTTPKDPAP